MARYSIDGDILDGIADAINEKYEDSSQISPVDMADDIHSLSVVPPGGLVATRQDVGKIVKWDVDFSELYFDALPTLTNPAGSGDILATKEALGGSGLLIVGSYVPILKHNWLASSPATIPAAEIANSLGGTQRYGFMTLIVNLGDEQMTVTLPVVAFIQNGALIIDGGSYSSAMGQGTVMEASGSGTGLTFSALYMIADGTLTDLTSMAGQIIGTTALSLYFDGGENDG